jgi:formyl-CoA transferase
MDLVGDERLRDGISRHSHSRELTTIIEDWLLNWDRAAAAEHFRTFGVPAAPIQDVDELIADPQVAARQMLLSIEDPEWGTVRVVGQPIKTSGGSSPPQTPPPSLGEHTDSVLAALAGLSAAAIDELRTAGVV